MRMFPLVLVPAALLALVACDSPKVEDTPPEEASFPCPILDKDQWVGHTFVHGIPKDNGGYDSDILARMQFYKEGDMTKVRYTVRSLVQVYSYSCSPDDKKGFTCWQDNPDLKEFCRSLIANDMGCTPEKLAEVTGVAATDPELKKVADSVNQIVSKLNPTEREKFNTGYNSPNTQLRGFLVVHPPKKVKKQDDCALNIQDEYMTYSYGKPRTMENAIGSAKFIDDSKEYVFEMCTDTADLTAVDDKGQAVSEAAPGDALTFKYIGKDKPEPGCTYSMDTFYNYEPVGKKVPVDKGEFSFTKNVMAKGRATAHMYRYKTCGDKPAERVNVSCTSVPVP